MRFCGENLFAYPGAWYAGQIDAAYQPRIHAPEFLSGWYEKFDAEKDIGFYEQPMDVVVVNPGEFMMFRPPYGAHGPSCSIDGPRRIRKIVIKVCVDP